MNRGAHSHHGHHGHSSNRVQQFLLLMIVVLLIVLIQMKSGASHTEQIAPVKAPTGSKNAGMSLTAREANAAARESERRSSMAQQEEPTPQPPPPPVEMSNEEVGKSGADYKPEQDSSSSCSVASFAEVDFKASEITNVDIAVEVMARLLHNGQYNEEKHKKALIDQFAGSQGALVTKPLRDFGTNPSLQRVFDHIRANYREAQMRPANDDTAFPVLGFICTGLDFNFLLNHIVHIDNTVQHWVVTVNGPGAAPRVFLRAVEKLLPGYFKLFVNDQNEGVAPAWNNILRVAFVDMAKKGIKVPFAAIGNADVMPAPGLLTKFCRATHAKHTKLVVNRFAHFAFFAVTDFGMRELGYFDEAMWPAYGEDVEYHLRAVSKGLGREDGPFGKEGSNKVNEVFWHYTAPNKDHNSWNTKMFTKFNRAEYIQQKWGVRMGTVVDFQFAKPFPNPFNNRKISHANSWIVDPAHRKCLQDVRSTRCRFETKSTAALENKQLVLPGVEPQVEVTKAPDNFVDLKQDASSSKRDGNALSADEERVLKDNMVAQDRDKAQEEALEGARARIAKAQQGR